MLTVGAGRERVLQKCLVTGPSMTAPSSPLQAHLPTDTYQCRIWTRCTNLFSTTTSKEEEACLWVGVEPLYDSAFTLEAPTTTILSVYVLQHLPCRQSKQQPTFFLFGRDCFRTPYRPKPGTNELSRRAAFQVSSGTVCEHWVVVFTLIKFTGLWGQACSNI